jgi:hypothetical protein
MIKMLLTVCQLPSSEVLLEFQLNTGVDVVMLVDQSKLVVVKDGVTVVVVCSIEVG